VPILDKLQRNEVFKAIEASEFDPRDFRRTEGQPGDDGETMVLIEHLPSQSVLMISRSSLAGLSMGHRVQWQVGDHPVATTLSPSAVNGSLTVGIDKWLAELKADIDTPDLWAEFDQQPPMSALLAGDDNTQFSAAEQDEIAKRLADVRRSVQETYVLSEEQMQALEAKLEYIGAAAKRVGRLDWLNLTVGALMGAAVSDVLTPAACQGILQALSAGLAHLFGHPMHSLGP
jgi:hypothetical protein